MYLCTLCGLICISIHVPTNFFLSTLPYHLLPGFFLVGFNVSVFGAGTESWPRRCCASNVCGRFCCPIGLHEMTLGIDFEGIVIDLNKVHPLLLALLL